MKLAQINEEIRFFWKLSNRSSNSRRHSSRVCFCYFSYLRLGTRNWPKNGEFSQTLLTFEFSISSNLLWLLLTFYCYCYLSIASSTCFGCIKMKLLLLLILALLAIEVAVDIEVAEGFGSSYRKKH